MACMLDAKIYSFKTLCARTPIHHIHPQTVSNLCRFVIADSETKSKIGVAFKLEKCRNINLNHGFFATFLEKVPSTAK
jgi:hypothetical protein